MLGEVHGKAEIGCTVQAADESIDHGLSDELDVADAREDLRIDEAGPGDRSGVVTNERHGTASLKARGR